MNRELNTILAALRYYQDACTEDTIPGAVYDIATNNGEHAPLLRDEIDALCERLNCGMTLYCYVRVYYFDAFPNAKVSFDHTFIQAHDEAEAYSLGQTGLAIDLKQLAAGYRVANDYVILCAPLLGPAHEDEPDQSPSLAAAITALAQQIDGLKETIANAALIDAFAEFDKEHDL